MLVPHNERDMTTLGKQFGQTRDPISLGIGAKQMVALVVVQWWANVPCIFSMARPGVSGFGGLLAPWGGKWETVPIVWTMYSLIRWHCGINARWLHHVEGGLNLWCEAIPQLQQEITIGCGKRTDEVCFKCLNHAFSCVDSVIVGLDKEVVALLLGIGLI